MSTPCPYRSRGNRICNFQKTNDHLLDSQDEHPIFSAAVFTTAEGAGSILRRWTDYYVNFNILNLKVKINKNKKNTCNVTQKIIYKYKLNVIHNIDPTTFCIVARDKKRSSLSLGLLLEGAA